MPSTSTTVHRGSRVPLRVLATNALGNPLPQQLAPDAASTDDTKVRVIGDPNDTRRFLIRGVAPGSATVTIGTGDNSLTIDVTCTARAVPADQVNRVELVAFEPEE